MIKIFSIFIGAMIVMCASAQVPNPRVYVLQLIIDGNMETLKFIIAK